MEENTASTLDILEPLDDSQDTLISFGGTIKALGDGKVGGYIVRFTDAANFDATGEYFTKDTDFDMEDGDRATIYYHHGLDASMKRRKLGGGTMKRDEFGIWAEAQLKMRDKYERFIYAMVQNKKMGWSTAVQPQLVEYNQKAVPRHILSWPLGKDVSLTPKPAAGFLTNAVTMKSYEQMAKSDPSLKALLPEDGQETISEDATAGDDDATVSDVVKEVKNMSETQDVPVLTADAIAEAMGTRMKAELEPVTKRLDDLEKELPVKDGGTNVTVTKDAVDSDLEGNPFKFGEFLQTIATNDADKRLLPLKSTDLGLKGRYFDVTKAMGAKFVGSIYNASMKAPTGLQEGIPSAGGFLVGTDRAAGLMERVYNVGQLIQRADMLPISANSNGMTFYAEDETSRATGSRRGGIRFYWAAEAEEKTKSKYSFREMEMKLRKAIGMVYATDELLADAGALAAKINKDLPEELAIGVEISMIRGTGVGQPLGVLNSGCVVSIAKETGQAATTIVAENIDKMWARRWIPGRNYAWFVHQDTGPALSALNRAVGTGGALVYTPPGGLSATPYATLKGAPVIEIEQASTLGTVGDIILADFGEYQMIDKGGVESESSIHVRFEYDETAFRFVYRVDGQPKWDTPLTPMNGTNTVSPFITLATRA